MLLHSLPKDIHLHSMFGNVNEYIWLVSNSSPFLPKQVLSGVITERNVITDAFNQHFNSAGFLFERNGGLINPGQSSRLLFPLPASRWKIYSTSSESLISFEQLSPCDVLNALLKIYVLKKWD